MTFVRRRTDTRDGVEGLRGGLLHKSRSLEKTQNEDCCKEIERARAQG